MIERVVLAGDVVTLRPLTIDDVDALVAAASEDRSTYGFTPVPDGDAAMRGYVEGVLADERVGWALPFVTTLTADGRVVGSTRFLDLDDWGPARRVGGPPLGAMGTPAHRGDRRHVARGVGATHRGEHRGQVARCCATRSTRGTSERITFKTDARNARSRAAIERVGAQFEGIRRAHVRASDGGIRDTAYYSIIRARSGPHVRKGLEARLATARSSARRGRRAERDADALDDRRFLLAGSLRRRRHRLGEVDEPGAHLGRLGDREPGDGRQPRAAARRSPRR